DWRSALTPNNPDHSDGSDTKKNGTSASRHRGAIDQRLVRALGHPVRVQALIILNERIASPNEISKELDQTVGHVSYHIKVLKECECIELVDTAPRRGAMEHYYRATDRAFLDASEWASLPSSIRPGLSASLLQTIMNDASDALMSGTFDKRIDRHLSWTPMLVDEQGWEELKTGLEEFLERIFDTQASSAERLAAEDAPGIPVTVAMMCFEALMSNERKVAPPKKKKN
ncbi:MAG: transcriptional regulator, ArsR family, partial [Solirubrobacterales bacterium]|nr:transcriptional regulator, ArsR family [Solirubrobacterales bacterium]